MNAFASNLVPNEQVIFSTKKHLIIFFFPLLLAFFSIFFSYYFASNPILQHIIWVPWLLTGIFWLYTWLEFRTSQFAVTNKRLLMREGFINRHLADLRLSSIAQVNVEQGLFGQIFGYGTLFINSFGTTDDFTYIANPTLFQRALNEQLDKVSGR